ncbi:competence type IV pilus minor pilin ComGD [Pediococcus claussenii]|uniref:Prepilin-type N-terminal cleavage/methylation domain protein n=1 Tax=Pediococcus claussenii (strain ATCC BAA-344 / DSM 14800 / JCM 18046 / KCTC 3811 / LMG 21948 / P06) TaxID=701521 RepID=G8PCQ5_PEDCP|nr:competence type IV pilus minor pilin ComGD [Pediococcus claussenii]AEV95040.1 prepilin-type N-terminal cleavage/methylation domain protein [Pediococcus claussenii ATCC BAA-344]ANZ70229.1 hypothetical protein AYR57_07790 [Pediococcus claussenii]ANZ72045.1 hypothetical protein AYR58_07790 [Pediococcus claussenii]KRN19158.1 hypothetical protein IV79_GL001530 [Pediococcus claussenii]
MIKKAFTLIESVTVLMIVSMILLIGLSGFKKYSVQYKEEFFWKQFEAEWDKAKQEAIYSHKHTDIHFDKENKRVFFTTGTYFNHYTYVIKLPNNLNFRLSRVTTLEANGHLPPQTINFFENNKIKYKLKFQLGWGVYQLEKNS